MTRVRKRSFIVLTILGPLLMAGVFVTLFWLGTQENESQKILVVDENYPLFKDLEKQESESLQFVCTDIGINEAQVLLQESDFSSILYLRSREGGILPEVGQLYFKKQPSFRVQRKIEGSVQDILEGEKLKRYDIDRQQYYSIRTPFTVALLKFQSPGESEDANNIQIWVGLIFGVFIYLFIFMYSIQVMRGVIEEKTNRIIEVMISSVKPMQLMFGKIIGVGMVGLTQFLLWIILTAILFGAGQYAIISANYSGDSVANYGQMTPEVLAELENNSNAPPAILTDPNSLFNEVMRVDYLLMLGAFLFYFLGGYLLYSALMAAVGAAVDSETDTQQFLLPVTLPLLLSYMASFIIMSFPEGQTAFWFSIIPFTSPIVMLVRIPFGVPWWELILSMSLLILGFIGTTWVAARIYRTGILMYGKKASYKELWKWIRFNG